jgi:hypothetical protein
MKMKLGFTPSIGFILDFECVVDVGVEWENGNPKLRVDDVFESSGMHSLFRTDDKFWIEFAARIADEAEKCPRLLARAIAQWDDEREAA